MSSPVRLAIVGLGLIGRRHATAIRSNPDVDLVGIVEPGAAGAEFAKKQGIERFETVELLLRDGAPDGIILATPTPLHAEQSLACIAARCAILVEKPLAVTTAEAQTLVDAAQAASVPVLVGHHRRHNPLIQKALEVVHSGSIGTVRAVQATCWFYKPDAYFDAAPWRKRKGAGPVSVNLVHDVDLMRAFCGEVTSVRAVASPSARGFENEDVAAAVLEFASGAIGTLTVSDSIAAPWSWEMTSREHPIYHPTDQSCYMIGGSKGSLSVPDLKVWTHDGDVPDWWAPMAAQPVAHEISDPLVNQITHFAQVILGAAQPVVSGVEGMRTLQVIEAIQASAQSGRAVQLPTIGLGHDAPQQAAQ